jgi:hypothetical protein
MNSRARAFGASRSSIICGWHINLRCMPTMSQKQQLPPSPHLGAGDDLVGVLVGGGADDDGVNIGAVDQLQGVLGGVGDVVRGLPQLTFGDKSACSVHASGQRTRHRVPMSALRRHLMSEYRVFGIVFSQKDTSAFETPSNLRQNS